MDCRVASLLVMTRVEKLDRNRVDLLKYFVIARTKSPWRSIMSKDANFNRCLLLDTMDYGVASLLAMTT
jgi:hypothetical protein